MKLFVMPAPQPDSEEIYEKYHRNLKWIAVNAIAAVVFQFFAWLMLWLESRAAEPPIFFALLMAASLAFVLLAIIQAFTNTTATILLMFYKDKPE